jgi:diaminopropionate ammonia-lyase
VVLAAVSVYSLIGIRSQSARGHHGRGATLGTGSRSHAVSRPGPMSETRPNGITGFAETPVMHYANPRAERGPWPSRLDAVLGADAIDGAGREIRRWSGYRPTPLLSLDRLAARTGVARVLYKDESTRFGLGSFKALGGAYAVLRLLMRETRLRADDIREGAQSERLRSITVVTATDGNHGRSVAWGASRFGCACRIYVHAGVSESRVDAMRKLGAEVVRVPGNYDDSVRQAAEDQATCSCRAG